jgi:acyl-CoA dehydrogenase
MGLRGTASNPSIVRGKGKLEQIMEVPFSNISSQTMVPFSHMVWSGCWLGTAGAAVNKARMFVRSQARAKPGTTPPTALRLAELMTKVHMFKTSIEALLSEYEGYCKDLGANADSMSSLSYALKMNNMKVSGAQILPSIVHDALMICGVVAYKNDSKFTMSRHLRDAYSASVMVGNDRILATNASMMMILKDS